MLVEDKDIVSLCDKLREEGKKIVFTNGCFDILHAGHVRYLAQARELGDCLIMGLNSDSSVRKLKGEGRPVNHELDRAEVIGALKAVDYVVIFSEPTAEQLIAKVKPHIYVKGGDYKIDTLPEAKIVFSYGGKIELLPFVEGRSTTKIINRIKENAEK